MAFQNQVNKYTAVGVEGQSATPNQSIYTAETYQADGDVKVGTFVFKSNKGAKQSGNGAVLGLVERVLNNFNYNTLSDGSNTITNGGNLTIAVRGDYYVTVTGQATVGQSVFASETDGTIKTGDAGTTQGGYVETPWAVKSVLNSTSTGGLVLISNWNTVASKAGGAPDLSGYAKVDLSNVTGTLQVKNGGTGSTSAENARSALGLGNIATQNAPLAVAQGGTGASTDAQARTNLKLGTIATQNTPLAVAQGGTGATNASDAKTNLEIAGK